MIDVTITVNGVALAVSVELHHSLLDLVRSAGYRGTKEGCAEGECGTCTVLLDEDLVCACLVPAAVCDGSQVVTVEGLDVPDLAAAMVGHGAVQCGFCTPGIMVTASALIERCAASGEMPSTTRVREELAGNLCRCTGYVGILGAVAETIRMRLDGRER